MRAFFTWLRRGILTGSLCVPLTVTGCVGTQHPVSQATSQATRLEMQLPPTPVLDADFAPSLYRVLRDGDRRPERLSLLTGVVRRQLAHASQRFASGHASRAADSVLGALYLVRVGEGHAEMIDASGEKALAGAIERWSARGDEGRTEALLRMRMTALPQGSPVRAEIDEHLAALAQWKKDTRNNGPMQRLGANERADVARALVDPSDAALAAAVSSVSAWIEGAIEANTAFQTTGRHVEHAEAIEIQRALVSGGATMATLFLRSGNAHGALQTLDQTGALRVILPSLYARIRHAATDDTARDWHALATAYAQRNPEPNADEAEIDPQLLRAGLWGTSLEAYRRDPKNFEMALLVSHTLVALGMPEATPLMLGDTLHQTATRSTVSTSMALLLTAIQDCALIEDIDAARRTFQAAGELLAYAERPDFQGRVEPSAARVYFIMAGVEMRAGELTQTRLQLTRAVTQEPTVGGYTTLALVERQAGNTAAALANVDRALGAPDAHSAQLDVADARLLSFELLRDAGQAARAQAALDAALEATLEARRVQGHAALRARSERLLGRVLESYGDILDASRAFDRALTAAAFDRPTLGASMLDVVGRALVRRDLQAARAALKRGLEGGAGDSDLVYGGLWVSLLERHWKAASDGTVERAISAGTKGSWTGKLSAWASGKLSDAELINAARSPSQRVEAAFYTAMTGQLAGDPSAEQRLKAVAGAPVIDLLEVQLARDLTAPRMRAQLPRGVKLP